LNISYAIQCHPSRLARARRHFGSSLPEESVTFACDPNPRGWSLPAATLAWEAMPPGADFHVLLQDDTTLSSEFVDVLPRILADLGSDRVLSLYLGWHSMTAAVARVWGACSMNIVPVADGFVPCQGVVLPAEAARGAGEFLRKALDMNMVRSDDQVLRDYVKSAGLENVALLPNLVQHDEDGLPSLVGGGGFGRRRSVAFLDDVRQGTGWPFDRVPGDPEAKDLPLAPFVHWNGLTECLLVQTGSGGWEVQGLLGWLHGRESLSDWLDAVAKTRAEAVGELLLLPAGCQCPEILVRHALLLGIATAEDRRADWNTSLGREFLSTACRNILRRYHDRVSPDPLMDLVVELVEAGATAGAGVVGH
jgi:hypothetical protein